MEFTPKQLQYFREANHRWNFKVGAVRAGKTHGDYSYVIPKRIRDRIGDPGFTLIMGVTKSTIERNVLSPMRGIYGDMLVGTISSMNTCNLFGEKAYCLGAENISQVSKIRGVSIKYCYGDEVAEWSPQVFDLLKSRLDQPKSCFDGALNPEGPNHWLKEFLDSDVDIYTQHYTIFDNPFLPKEFVENLCREYEGTVYYKRYILGEWALAEGLIYPMYEDAIEEPPKNAIPSDYSISIDYGTENAFAAILWAKIGRVWWGVSEYYHSGRDTGIAKTDEEYAQDIIKWLADEQVDRKEMRIIIDPSAASFRVLMRKKGFSVMKGKNDVLDGIRDTATCLKNGRVKISPKMKSTINEIKAYCWKEEAETDTPVKVNDHAMDSMRYMVRTLRLAKVEPEYHSPFMR